MNGSIVTGQRIRMRIEPELNEFLIGGNQFICKFLTEGVSLF